MQPRLRRLCHLDIPSRPCISRLFYPKAYPWWRIWRSSPRWYHIESTPIHELTLAYAKTNTLNSLFINRFVKFCDASSLAIRSASPVSKSTNRFLSYSVVSPIPLTCKPPCIHNATGRCLWPCGRHHRVGSIFVGLYTIKLGRYQCTMQKCYCLN